MLIFFLQMISFVSIGVNMGIIYWTSNALSYILQDHSYTSLEIFMLVILIEHIIIGFKLLVSNLIKDKPEWVSVEERRHNMMMGDIYNAFERKEDNLKEAGKKTLEERIRELKEGKRVLMQRLEEEKKKEG